MKHKEIEERRNNAATQLMHQIPRMLTLLSKDEQINPVDQEQIMQLKSDIREKWILPTDLLKFRGIFKRYCSFRYLEVKTLKKLSYFMCLEPVTGFNIINNLLKPFRM